jgi:hypothetical protein
VPWICSLVFKMGFDHCMFVLGKQMINNMTFLLWFLNSCQVIHLYLRHIGVVSYTMLNQDSILGGGGGGGGLSSPPPPDSQLRFNTIHKHTIGTYTNANKQNPPPLTGVNCMTLVTVSREYCHIFRIWL